MAFVRRRNGKFGKYDETMIEEDDKIYQVEHPPRRKDEVISLIRLLRDFPWYHIILIIIFGYITYVLLSSNKIKVFFAKAVLEYYNIESQVCVFPLPTKDKNGL